MLMGFVRLWETRGRFLHVARVSIIKEFSTKPIALSCLPSRGLTPRNERHDTINIRRLSINYESYPYRFQDVHWNAGRRLFSQKSIDPVDPKEVPSSSLNDSQKNTLSQMVSTRETIKKLWRMSRTEIPYISGAIGLLFIASGVHMLVPYGIGKFMDYIIAGDVVTRMHDYAFVIGSVIAIGGISNFGRVVLIKVVGERVVARLRSQLFDRIVRQDVAFFDMNRTGELISRLSADTNALGKGLFEHISHGTRHLITAVAGIGIMGYMSPKLTLIMLGIVPPVFLCAMYYGRFVKSLSKQSQDALSETTKIAEERISNIRTVRAFAQELRESERYSQRVMQVYTLARKEALATGGFFGGVSIAGNLALLIALWKGGQMVILNEISTGQLTSFLMYSVYVGSGMAGISAFYGDLMKSMGASHRVFQLIEKSPELVSGTTLLPSIRGDITFQNVIFAYPSRKENLVLNHMNMLIKAGTKVAIVGESGSGKSTIASLLLRFYAPDEGRIFLDGHDISELNLDWLHRQIAIVSQEPTLFATSIAENITYGAPDSTMEQIKEVARMAQAAEFIENFPQAYLTSVGERGITLSGGQKQRIAIARAILKNPQILILDEATSALDTTSEMLVQKALNHLMEGKTVLIIAHRLATIKKADSILVLKGGQLVENGSYDELIRKPEGLFRKMIENQTLDL